MKFGWIGVSAPAVYLAPLAAVVFRHLDGLRRGGDFRLPSPLWGRAGRGYPHSDIVA